MRDTVGLDPSMGNTSFATFLGDAIGQTFFAPDTVISRITVWRPSFDVDAVGTRLFVTAVDTTRTPPFPDTRQILQDGPTVFVRDDSGAPGQPIEMMFVLDPPLKLPRPGIYAFFLQREGCDGGETRIVGSDMDPYPHGIVWDTNETIFQPCYLPFTEGGADLLDLIFQIEFCRDPSTPVLPASWGRLKAIYR